MGASVPSVPSGLSERHESVALIQLGGLFDGARPGANSNAPAVPVPPPAGPRLPHGFDRVAAHTVRAESDVLSLIPASYSGNSGTLRRKLARNVAKMQPYEIYTYFDRKGGTVIGIDLSRKPELIDILPEQQSHEVRLIKKVQAWNLDLQVVVREEGATPDLIVGGIFTELKTRMGGGKSLAQLLEKANSQVASHAQRHGSGPGAVIIDLANRQDGVPELEVAAELDSWRRDMAAGGRAVALRKIYVFGGSELKEFDRQADGSYAPAAAVAMPFAPVAASRRAPRAAPPRTALADAFARERVEKTVRHWMKKGRYRAALRVFEDFALVAGPGESERVRARLGSLLEAAKAKAANPKPRLVKRGR